MKYATYTKAENQAFTEGFDCVTKENGVRADNPYEFEDSNLARCWSDGFDNGAQSMEDCGTGYGTSNY